MAKRYSEEVEAYLKANYLTMTSVEMAEKIGRTPNAIGLWLRQHQLKTPKSVVYASSAKKHMGKTTSTPETDAFILKHYLIISKKKMAELTGRSETFFACRIRQLGLVIPTEHTEQNKLAGRFKKGLVPHNKGNADFYHNMPEEVKERVKRGHFPKGNEPMNTAEKDGTIRIRHEGTRPYQYIRLSKSKWRPLHQVIWEAENGPQPKGHVVRFRDGNTLNTCLENLQLISRSENMKLNNPIPQAVMMTDNFILGQMTRGNKELREELRGNKELIDLQREQYKLKNLIKSHENESNRNK